MFLTGRFLGKFAVKSLLKILPHLAYAATLPCETLMSDNYYIRLTAFFSRITWVSRYQKGKTSLDLNEARDDHSIYLTFIVFPLLREPRPQVHYRSQPNVM